MLNTVYDSKEEIPAGFDALFTEQGGKWVMTGVNGMKTVEDVTRLQTALNKERNDHKAVKTTLGTILGGRKAEEIQADLDRIPELEAAAGAGADPKKFDEAVNARLTREKAPLERRVTELTAKAAELDTEIVAFRTEKTTRVIHDSIRKAAVEAKVLPSALDDVLLLSERVFELGDDGRVAVKDKVGFTPGLEPVGWLSDMQTKRPHWWPASQGGGSGGGGGGGMDKNPFSYDNWNMTAQGVLVSSNPTRAAQLAAAAGTTVGGRRPIKKV